MKNLKKFNLRRFDIRFREIIIPLILPRDSRLLLKLKIDKSCFFDGRSRSWIMNGEYRSINTIILLLHEEAGFKAGIPREIIYYAIYKEIFVMLRELVSGKRKARETRGFIHYTMDFLLRTGKEPSRIDSRDVEKYLSFLFHEKRALREEIDTAVDSLNFFFRKVLRKAVSVKSPINTPEKQTFMNNKSGKEHSGSFPKAS